MPLLFAYGVNRFSHDIAHLILTGLLKKYFDCFKQVGSKYTKCQVSDI